jgi:hypothetical protein
MQEAPKTIQIRMQTRIRNTVSNVLTIVTSQHAEGFEDEPPLLEELGINPDHILQVRGSISEPYYIQHCFICRPSYSTVPTDGIEPGTVATLAVRLSNH